METKRRRQQSEQLLLLISEHGARLIQGRRTKWTYDITAAISVALSCVICAAQSQAARTVHLSGYVQEVSDALVPGTIVTVHGSRLSQTVPITMLWAPLRGLTNPEIAVGQATPFRLVLDLEQDRDLNIRLKIGSAVTAQAKQDALKPDASTQGYTSGSLRGGVLIALSLGRVLSIAYGPRPLSSC